MQKLKMYAFSTDEINAEVLNALNNVKTNFENKCGDVIYEGTIFDDIHPKNNPKSDFSEEALNSLEKLIALCEDADNIQIWMA
jgi:hypothetical protein